MFTSKKGKHVAKAKKKRRRNRQWYAELHDLHFEHRQPKDLGPGLSPPDPLAFPLITTLMLAARRNKTKSTSQTTFPALKKSKGEPDEPQI